MTCEVLVFNVGTTTDVEIVLADKTDTPINDATVTITVRDSDGDDVAGDTWPLDMPYIFGSDGRYGTALSSALDMTANVEYKALILVTRPNSDDARYVRTIKAQDG